jgi:hypothetical protein
VSQLPPDPFVRTALQLLPVPEHGEGFWAELDALLDAEPPRQVDEPALAVGPTAATVVVPGRGQDEERVFELVPRESTGLVPMELRRRSNAVLSVVAVAAALMVVVASANLVRQRADDGVGTELADSADDPRSDLISSTSTSLAAIVGDAAEVPTDAVMAWVGALASGDTAAAWTSMGPASQAHFGSRSAFTGQGSSLAEGYGAWSGATPDDVLVTPVATRDGGSMVVVTLIGAVSQEGTTQRRAVAVPVRMVDGTPHVEPFAFAGELEMVVPEPAPASGDRPVVSTDDELVVVVPRGVAAPTIRLDDGDTLVCGESEGTELTELDGAPGQRCSYHPAGGIPVGERVLTVAVLSSDGSGISAAAVLFEAA